MESEYMYVRLGVPQGSILVSLLFSICVNELVTASKKFQYHTYADGTTIDFNLEALYCINVEEMCRMI